MIIPKELQRFKKKMRGCRKIQLLYLVLQCVGKPRKTYIRRLLRFGFDGQKSWKNFKLSVKNKAAVNAPQVCYIHTPKYLYSHWCIHTPTANIGIGGLLYMPAWGFCVARFDRQGIFQEPLTVKRAQCRASRFFCVFTLPFLCITGGICSLDRIYPYGYI